MADFAGQLNGAQSIGEALTQAKDTYFLSRVAFSSYDEKTLSEAELYGLPMYGVGTAPAPLNAAAVTPAAPDPVNGATGSTSPSEGTLDELPRRQRPGSRLRRDARLRQHRSNSRPKRRPL